LLAITRWCPSSLEAPGCINLPLDGSPAAAFPHGWSSATLLGSSAPRGIEPFEGPGLWGGTALGLGSRTREDAKLFCPVSV